MPTAPNQTPQAPDASSNGHTTTVLAPNGKHKKLSLAIFLVFILTQQQIDRWQAGLDAP